MKAKLTALFLFVFSVFAVSTVWAVETVVDMHALTPEGVGAKMDTISISETDHGALFTPQLSGLSPGLHGFHVHANGSCGVNMKDGKMVPGLAAGGHFDRKRPIITKVPMTTVTWEIYPPSMPIRPVQPHIRGWHPEFIWTI